VRTVDVKGNVIGLDTNGSAPLKTIDSVGRAVQAEAKSVAEQAASTNPELPKEVTDAKPEGEDKPTEAKIRKLYLDAQKAERRAIEREKRAQEGLTRAEAFERDKALAESGEDPTAILKAAGLDEVKFYQNMTQYALSEKARKPEDPVQKELREHKERLDKYSKDLEIQAKTIQDKEDLASHNRVIADKVIPMLNEAPDKYEALLAEYGSNAAVEVYRTVWDIYQQTGKARTFAEVADEMESYWTEKISEGISSAAKLKKFQNRFAQNDTGRRDSTERVETPRRSVTLSNKPSAPAPDVPAIPRKRYQTRDERVAEILKKFG
jgi:hypothetical protein